MFRFDSFRKSDTANTSVSSTDVNTEQVEKPRPANFIRRMASAETLLHSSTASVIKRPSFSKLHNSFSSSSGSSNHSASLSIPFPTNSWGMLALSRLRAADDGEFDDVIDLLLSRDKVVLLLPVSQPSHPSAIIDREFIQDHVLVCQKSGDLSQVISLSGIRGTFQSDQFVALGLLPAKQEVSSIIAGSPTKKSLFDTFSLDPSSITTNCPRYNILHNHIQLPLRDDKAIKAMLIQKPISRTEVSDWEKNSNNEAKTTAVATTAQLAESVGNDPRVKDFIKSYRRRPPHNLDTASNQFLAFLDDLAGKLDDDQRVDAIEAYLCYELYDCLFAIPGGDEPLQDEALESRIAALNLLDLNLSHLGVIVEDESEIKDINGVVKEAGIQLQQLNSIPDAKGKLQGLVKTHQIVVDAIEGFAEKYRQAKLDTESEVVQEMKHAMSAANEEEKAMSRKPLASDKSETEPLGENLVNKNPVEKEEKEIGATEKSPAVSTGSDSQTLKAANADVLLPLLIFSIVKSNPTNFLSNLRFIQRFRRPSRVSGQESYCLTNMMAAVSFLETTNLVGLGLSADKVLSHNPQLYSLSESPPLTPPKTTPEPPRSTSIDAAQAGGLKLMSEMVDNSYKMFDGLGRLWQWDGPKPTSKGSTASASATESESETDVTAGGVSGRSLSVTESELKDMASNKDPLRDESSSWSSRFIENRTRRPDALHALLQAPSQLIHSVSNNSNNHNSTDGVIQKFLDKKSVEELTIGEVGELLADYKRLAAVMKQARLC